MSNYLFCHQVSKLPLTYAFNQASDHKISIWIIDTDLHRSRLPVFRNLLTSEEQQRADRFYRENDTINFIIRRGALRLLLAAELTCQPAEITFLNGTNGKPKLAGADEIHFNSSHSGNFAAIAIARQPIGIDLEVVKNDFDCKSVAEYAFSEKEAYSLALSPDPVRDFFSIWTRKEAFLKAIGTGLGNDIHLLNCLDGKQSIPDTLATENTDDWASHTTEIADACLLSIAAKSSGAPLYMEFREFDKNLLPVPA